MEEKLKLVCKFCISKGFWLDTIFKWQYLSGWPRSNRLSFHVSACKPIDWGHCKTIWEHLRR